MMRKQTIMIIWTLDAQSLPKSTIKQNDMFESIRIMINKTVLAAIHSSSDVVREEIKCLKSTVDNQLDEISSLKSVFKSQIQSLSDKEMRHHLESNLGVKEELTKITSKLEGMDHLKMEMTNMKGNLRRQMEELTRTSEESNSNRLEKITTMEVIEQNHHKIQIDRIEELDKSHRSLANQIKSSEDQSEIWEARIATLEHRIQQTDTKVCGF